MPGGMHVTSAITLPAGAVEVGTIDGYGHSSGLLSSTHKFDRALGSLAVAYAPLDILTIGLSLDGRYDKHFGAGFEDDGYVGDPRLMVRVAKGFGTAHVGAQLGLWVPGKNAPSVSGSATSVDLRAIASIPAGPAMLSVDVGFRLDNSSKSAADLGQLSLSDRISLGVSDYNELFGGAHVTIPAGKAWVGLEGSIEAFLGSPPSDRPMATLDDGKIIVRGTLTGGYHFTDEWSLLAFLDVAKSPGITAAQVMSENIPIVPYEPNFTFGIGLDGRFGGPKRDTHIRVNDCAKTNTCEAKAVDEFADVSGQVTDDGGTPIVGAKITVKLSKITGTGATDDKGNYTVSKLKIGETKAGKTELDDTGAEINVEVDQKKPGRATLTLAKGPNTVPVIKLDPLLPPGTFSGFIHDAKTGKGIANATITIADKKTESDPEGAFKIELPPGSYKASFTAKGFAPQELEIVIDPNGINIKNVDLHK